MASFFRRFSTTKDDSASEQSGNTGNNIFTRRRSSADSTSGRIYGARDYKLMIAPAALQFRRDSIVDEYTTPENSAEVVGVRKYSVPFGPRHHLLATRERTGSV